MIAHSKLFPTSSGTVPSKNETSMHDTFLSSLTVRIDEPYWLLHKGNCQHFVVFDQIRRMRASDGPAAAYPKTLHIAPVSHPLCRGCLKVPARWSISGDVRLGESPCVLCDPCWKSMGAPADDQISAVALPKYELGW